MPAANREEVLKHEIPYRYDISCLTTESLLSKGLSQALPYASAMCLDAFPESGPRL